MARRHRAAHAAHSTDSTAVWMPSVAPLVNSSSARVHAPSTRRARPHGRRAMRAFKPGAVGVLLGLPYHD
ncbi:MAG: hypothetical protein QM777_18655 [Pseudorhodoferax sp.]